MLATCRCSPGSAAFDGGLAARELGLEYTPVPEAINAPDFFLPKFSSRGTRVQVPAGRFPKHVLASIGYAYDEVDMTQPGLGGDGMWVAISRDPSADTLSPPKVWATLSVSREIDPSSMSRIPKSLAN